MGTNAQARPVTEWVCGLLDSNAYPHAVSRIQLIETHISWVFLTGDFAYKVKKPVDLGFVDFSTLQKRKYYCEEELRLNRRTTADLYCDVVPIGLQAGMPVIGAEPALEYAVRMRQFQPSDRLDRALETIRVRAEDILRLAALVAVFHDRLPPKTDIEPGRAGERASWPALNNFGHIGGDHISAGSRRRIDAIEAWTRRSAKLLDTVFRQRAADGCVRECHGDLHLANLFLHRGVIYPFDSLEFNPGLRWIDRQSDIAFLVMDLMARGRNDLAYIFLNAYLEHTGDYGGLAVLRFYLVYRCMVRLKVASIQAQQLHEGARGEHAIKARHYLDLATALMKKPAHPLLVLMHGVSGSGKTWSSERMIPVLPAIRVRSDLERKRLHGVAPAGSKASRPEVNLYSRAATLRTYRAMAGHCATGLGAGFNMVADATFLRRERRREFIDMGLMHAARIQIVPVHAPLETLRERIRQRQTGHLDASDADLAVLDQQLRHSDPLEEDELALAMRDTGQITGN